ncbi:MAG: 3-deoxy-manno-octulosonate cytidylyltransferase [Candidatus Parcubacteria bacterium]|jgi:3-deoxy-manno-octulosonate cytidylyltransferase (CMP-KDO synthetase)
MKTTTSLKVLGVIPARLKSTRLPEKLIKDIHGKPLIYHTWRRALLAKTLSHVLIATDSKIIFDLCRSFGADVLMTRASIQCGSDRVADAAKKFTKFKPDIVVNIQGDEPMMPKEAIDRCVMALSKNWHNQKIVVSTPATPFLHKADIESPNFVKVVSDKQGNALFFSRSVIPFPRDPFEAYCKHLGLYVFRADFLQKYVKLSQTPLEKAEKLEQLRILENGYDIQVVKGNFRNMEVNTAEELDRAREMMK